MTLYPDRTELCGSRHAKWVPLCLLLSLFVLPIVAHASTAAFEPNWFMVVDRADALDEGQEQSAINDAWRLNMDGVPTQVVTEFAGLNQSQADQRAQELRIAHAIESSPGADDGILVYLAVDAKNREAKTLAISVGSHALPVNGLTMDTLRETFHDVMTTQLNDGRQARAIVYGLRQLIYLEQFESPALEPLDSGMKTLRSVLTFLAPLALVASAGVGMLLAHSGSRGRQWAMALGMGAVATVLAAISVPSRSSIGIWCALVIGLLALWRLIQIDNDSPLSGRILKCTPRRTFTSKRSQRTGSAL